MPSDGEVAVPVAEEAHPGARHAAAGHAAARREVLLAALFMVLGIFGSRVLGLVRVQVQSWWFRTDDVGALRAAFDLPDLLFYIIAGGALRSGFVPVFVPLLQKGRIDPEAWKKAWWLFSVLVTTVALLSIVVVALGMIFAEPLTAPMTGRWSGKGFSPEGTRLTITLLRWILPAQLFLLVGGVLSGTLDAMRRTRVTAMVPCFYNLCIIVAMCLLRKQYGPLSAAFGVIIGGLVSNLIWQAWALVRYGREYGFRFKPTLAFRDPLIRDVIATAAPIVLGLCVAEVNLKIAGWAGAAYGESARAWFDNASRLARLPDGIFGAGLGIALFPYLSHMFSEGRHDEFRLQAEHILRLAVVCTVPLAALLLFAPKPPVAVLFGHGMFKADDVAHTAVMLSCFAVGIVPLTLSVVLTRVFYARKDTLTPLRAGAVAVVFAAVASVLLGRVLGWAGAPLGFSLSCWFNTAQLLWAYQRDGGFAEPAVMRRSLLACHLAAGIAGAAGWIAVRFLPGGDALHALASCVIVLGGYVLVLKWLGLDELGDVLRVVRQRMRPSALGGAET